MPSKYLDFGFKWHINVDMLLNKITQSEILLLIVPVPQSCYRGYRLHYALLPFHYMIFFRVLLLFYVIEMVSSVCWWSLAKVYLELLLSFELLNLTQAKHMVFSADNHILTTSRSSIFMVKLSRFRSHHGR